MQKEILISVIIPVKNGDYWLDQTLKGIVGQTVFDRSEIIVIDSGSTDRTLQILERFPVRVISIPPSAFNHGETRNLGVREAKGKYVVMTVQDAQPTDERWLQKLLDGFDNENVAGVCGQQIVSHEPDKNPVEWFRPVSPPAKTKYFYEDIDEFHRLSPGAKRNVCGWDNVNAMYRKEALLRVPFRAVSFAEDAMWAKDAIEAGYAIVYNREARVNHYHFETPEYAFRRYFTVCYHFYKIFGLRPSYLNEGPGFFLRAIKLLLKAKSIRWKDKWKWFWYNYRLYFAINRSVRSFSDALRIGENELDRLHNEICGAPPQAVKPVL
jgi:rhamnosyltransferase